MRTLQSNNRRRTTHSRQPNYTITNGEFDPDELEEVEDKMEKDQYELQCQKDREEEEGLDEFICSMAVRE